MLRLRAMRDPYEVLGLDPRADDSEIKTAFRRLAAQHHPDRNPEDPGAHDRFKEINQAHQILSDPQKRAAYDRYGAGAFTPGAAGRGPGFPDFASFDVLFGDILGALGIRPADRGDVRVRLKLTFAEAALGCTKEVVFERVEVCDACRGSGAEPGADVSQCPACRGRGRVRGQHALFPLPTERQCSRCHGTGRVAASSCRSCRGKGARARQHREMVDIPAGIESGSSKVVEHAGNVVRAGRLAGDLEVIVEVQEHPFFRRDGDDIVCRMPISFTQASLGGELDVPTLQGSVKLRVPPGTQSAQVLRLRGKGVPHRLRPGRGDLRVEVLVEIPEQLSDRARQLIRELGEELGEELHPQQKKLFERIKAWFA